jgi:hypothetical protein
MSTNYRSQVAYGLSQALIQEPPSPIIAQRAPTTSDKAAYGTIWVNQVTNTSYVLTSIESNISNWEQLGSTVTATTWQTAVGATNLVSNNGYFVNGAATVVFTLPLIAAVGDTFQILVLDTAVDGWQINQNAGQYIIGNEQLLTTAITTVGVGGSVSTGALDAIGIRMVCAIANTAFIIPNADGLTFV